MDLPEKDRVPMLDRDKSIILASEEVHRRNTEAAVQHCNETRRMLRVAEARITNLEKAAHAQMELITQYREQLANLQQQFYNKGTTSYADEDQKQ